MVDSGNDQLFYRKTKHLPSLDQRQYYEQLNGASSSISPSPSYVLVFKTNRSFNDISAWYHLLLVHDTTQDEANERVRSYRFNYSS